MCDSDHAVSSVKEKSGSGKCPYALMIDIRFFTLMQEYGLESEALN